MTTPTEPTLEQKTLEENRIALGKMLGWNTEKELLGSVYVYRDAKGDIQAALPQITLENVNPVEIKLAGAHVDNYQKALYEIVNPGRSFMTDFFMEWPGSSTFLQNFICANAGQRLKALRKIKSFGVEQPEAKCAGEEYL